MTFEEFEKFLAEKGYGIVACNHYSLDGSRRLYCAILGKNGVAFKAEGMISSTVFAALKDKVNGWVDYKEAVKEYIRDCFGDTDVGKEILKSFEPIILSPMPKMPWEKE